MTIWGMGQDERVCRTGGVQEKEEGGGGEWGEAEVFKEQRDTGKGGLQEKGCVQDRGM
jgi:hypothetical protein